MLEDAQLIVGLGNPGEKYENTRHNIGVTLLRVLLEHYESHLDAKLSNNADYTIVKTSPQSNKKLVIARLHSYMNLSGVALQKLLQYLKIDIKNTLVLHDEIEFIFGRTELKQGGGHRGHNGLRHIIQNLGADFSRIQIGVGRPEHSSQVADYVLSKFKPEEAKELPIILERAKAQCLEWLKD